MSAEWRRDEEDCVSSVTDDFCKVKVGEVEDGGVVRVDDAVAAAEDGEVPEVDGDASASDVVIPVEFSNNATSYNAVSAADKPPSFSASALRPPERPI